MAIGKVRKGPAQLHAADSRNETIFLSYWAAEIHFTFRFGLYVNCICFRKARVFRTGGSAEFLGRRMWVRLLSHICPSVSLVFLSVIVRASTAFLLPHSCTN